MQALKNQIALIRVPCAATVRTIYASGSIAILALKRIAGKNLRAGKCFCVTKVHNNHPARTIAVVTRNFSIASTLIAAAHITES